MGQIRSSVVKKVRKWSLSIGFFHTLHEEYLLKEKVVVVQTPEWIFKANIARIILGPDFFPSLGQRW